MNYRVTPLTLANNTINFSRAHSSNLATYQTQLSTGIRVQKPSDDPFAIRELNSLQSQIRTTRSSSENIDRATSSLNSSVFQLREVNTLVTKARTLAQQGANELDDDARNALKTEAEHILGRLQDIANSSNGGSFHFSGSSFQTKPFEFSDATQPGQTISTSYLGSTIPSHVLIDESVSVETFYSGTSIFQSRQRGETEYYGGTGLASGQSVDTATSRGQLIIKHTLTTYGGGAGLQAGTDSVDGDTIIGDLGQHELLLTDTAGDGSAGTVILNGGEEFSFTNTDTNLKITGPDGEIVYLDTTSITPGFDGAVNVIANGTISADNGATEVAITFDANQSITNSLNGEITYVDSTSVSFSGKEHVEYTGTSDLFQTFHELVLDLGNDRDLSSPEIADSLNRRLGDLERYTDHVLNVVGEQSAWLQSLEQMQGRLADIDLEAQSRLIDIASVDIPEVVVKMQFEQSLLEYTYAASAQINQLSLLNFLG